MTFDKNKNLKSLSSNLRKNMTKQEKQLWYQFLKFHRYTFNRQFIIGNYIVDFYCNAKKLIIELDGGQHYEEDALKYDEERTKYFNNLGIRVIRFTNVDIDKYFENVCQEIEYVLSGMK